MSTLKHVQRTNALGRLHEFPSRVRDIVHSVAVNTVANPDATQAQLFHARRYAAGSSNGMGELTLGLLGNGVTPFCSDCYLQAKIVSMVDWANPVLIDHEPDEDA
jgi:hypothetical protein